MKSGFPICNRNAIYFSFRFLFCFVFVRFNYSFLGAGEGVGNMTELFSGISRKTRTLGTTGFSRLRREFSVLAEGRQVFGRRPKPRAAKLFAGHHKDLTETGNRARKVSGTQGRKHENSFANVFFGLCAYCKIRNPDCKSKSRFSLHVLHMFCTCHLTI